jgi:hypothetical protein
VPEKHLGTKNGILVIEHPDYEFKEEGNQVFVSIKRITSLDLIADFPGRNGGYGTDPKHGIPYGERDMDDVADNHLIRDKGGWVGQVSLGYGCSCSLQKRAIGMEADPNIYLQGTPSYPLGMVVKTGVLPSPAIL